MSTQFAAAKAGLILVNINPSYRPNELAYALQKCSVRALIADVEWGKQNFVNVLRDSLKEATYSNLEYVAFRDMESIPKQRVYFKGPEL